MIQERNKYIELLKQNNYDPAGRRHAIEAVNSSDIKAHGKSIPFSFIPLFINRQDFEFFNGEIHKVQQILNKITAHYVADPSYREIFGFSQDMEELICLPCNYSETIPIGRYDIFYNEDNGEYFFCEFNTDGSGGMSRDFEMSRAILENFLNKHDKEGIYSCFDTIGDMADEMIRIYRSSTGAVDNPLFCVTDFREEGVFSDFNRFIQAFKNRGIEARFTDVRDLIYDGNRLYDRNDGRTIHGIYRRAVTSVVLERMDECTDLIEALKDGNVTLMGHFRTSLVHSKVVLSAMHHPLTAAFLTDSENEYIREHIPVTVRFTRNNVSDEFMKELLDNKNEWLIKPEEGFGSHGVVCGMDVTQEQWINEINNRIDNNDVVQKFCPRYEVPLLGPEDQTEREYPLMLGIYQAAGRAVGFYSRAGHEGVIDFDHGGICVSTLFVENQKDKLIF